MKYLDVPHFARLNTFLDTVDVGNYVVCGGLEAYSCKLAGLDKKLSRSLDEEIQMESPPSVLAESPVGPTGESASRKTLIYLILTLNHALPDYDFSQLRAHHFKRELDLSLLEETVQRHLSEIAKVWESAPDVNDLSFLESVRKAIDEAIELNSCEVYQYRPDVDADLFDDEGKLWSFAYLFYNRKLKRTVMFGCRGVSKIARRKSATLCSDSSDTESDVDYGMAAEMDV
ncbi:unnamed protein product [Ostreobium quekettii]|uniref:Repressor of RNA polymerase III transcription n=1 Tax=Ostreobium quekettii TaxID=121088 RepID=A0A8S1IJV9_9CHLO|nr:unnamed protein product [Ostreobium quekettii]|eukprot:evm.model.scf_5.3 EVM.evm.TU.scf_5.3   scf_5:32163-35317(-)